MSQKLDTRIRLTHPDRDNHRSGAKATTMILTVLLVGTGAYITPTLFGIVLTISYHNFCWYASLY